MKSQASWLCWIGDIRNQLIVLHRRHKNGGEWRGSDDYRQYWRIHQRWKQNCKVVFIYYFHFIRHFCSCNVKNKYDGFIMRIKMKDVWRGPLCFTHWYRIPQLMCLVFLDTRRNISAWEIFGGGCLWSRLIVKGNLKLACSPIKVRTKENYLILRWNTQFELTHISVNSNFQISVFYRVIFKEEDLYWKFQNNVFTFAFC